MARKALYVGIESYQSYGNLPGCCKDAQELAALLQTHDNGGPNFTAKVLAKSQVTTAELSGAIHELFQPFDGDILFYFSGHGDQDSTSHYLITSNAAPGALGFRMNDLLTLAEGALKHCQSVTIILDCCHAGAVGNNNVHSLVPTTQLAEGITLLAAASTDQAAVMINNRSAFTQLLMRALNGGAADPRGRVTTAAVYAFIESSFGPFHQRPIYKTHEFRSTALRYAEPSVQDSELRRLTELFATPDAVVQLSADFENFILQPDKVPKYDCSDTIVDAIGNPEKLNKRKLLKNFQLAGLARLQVVDKTRAPPDGKLTDLFWACLYGQGVRLTVAGRFYWDLVNTHRI